MSMTNLEFYNSVAEVPESAKTPIGAGRLKGMTDINPMWRIQKLTESFGMCGFGWKYEIVDKHLERGADGVVCVFVDIALYIKHNGEWSDAIIGTGGSTFVAAEKNGLYTSDECFKMALTDALSVACKALGMGANVYWQGGRTKYTSIPETKQESPLPNPVFGGVQYETAQTPRSIFLAKLKEKGIDAKEYAKEKGLDKSTTDERYEELIKELG